MGHSSSRPAADAEQNDELWVEEEEGNDEEESECDICSEDCASDVELDIEVEVSILWFMTLGKMRKFISYDGWVQTNI